MRSPPLLLVTTALLAILAAAVLQLLSGPTPRSDAPEAAAYWRQCTPRIERHELASSPLPPLSRRDSRTSSVRMNHLAYSLRRELEPRLYRDFGRQLREEAGWRAFDRWSGDYFVAAAEAGAGPRELLVKRSNSSSVKFANLRVERPFARLAAEEVPGAASASNVKWPPLPLFHTPFRAQNLSVRDFFRELAAAPSTPPSDFLYFADGVSVLGALGRDILPLEPLCPGANVARDCDSSVWIGAKGVTAWPHYDSSHNLFVQVAGRKKFTLAAPTAARCGLGLFPSLHPFYRQAQYDLMDPTRRSQPVLVPSTGSLDACCTLHVFDVELSAGDALYIPPHWFHRVTSLSTPNFAINSWWSSEAFRRMARVLALPLPFEGHWTQRQTVLAAREYLRVLFDMMEQHLRAVQPESAPVPGPFLASELLVARFAPLFDGPPLTAEWCTAMQRNLSLPSTADDTGLSGCAGLRDEELRGMLPDNAAVAADAPLAVLLVALRAHFAPYAERVMAQYRRVPAEMARLHVQNLAEEVAHYAVRTRVEALYPFLACCVLQQ